VAQLQNYLRSHPNGARAKEAESRIADLTWNAVDQANIDAVRRFARENPGNPHKADAQKILDQYDAEQQRIAQERARQQAAVPKQDLPKQAQVNAERVRQDDVRKQQVLDTLKQFDAALQRKRARDVKAIWPAASQLFLESLGNSRVKMSLVMRPEDVRFAEGSDRAVAECELVTLIDASQRRQKAVLTLRNPGGTWTIETAKFD
jgi:hypothetical protein